MLGNLKMLAHYKYYNKYFKYFILIFKSFLNLFLCSNTIKVLTGAYVYNFELIIAALTAPQFHAKGCPGLKPSAPFYLLSIPISYLPTFIQKRDLKHHDLLKQVVHYCYINQLVNWPLMKG